MLKISEILTTTDNRYEDLIYEGNIQEFADDINNCNAILELLYRKEDGGYASMFLNQGVIESVSLAHREVRMEEVITENGVKAYRPAPKKTCEGKKVRFMMPKAMNKKAFFDFYMNACKETVFPEFKEEITSISETGYDRMVQDIVADVVEVFPPSEDKNLDRIAYFLSVPCVMYVGALLEDNAEIFQDGNELELAEALHKFILQNKDFEIFDDPAED